MNVKWIITFDTTPFAEEADFETFAYISDSEAMAAIAEHVGEWCVVDVCLVSNWKGDLDE